MTKKNIMPKREPIANIKIDEKEPQAQEVMTKAKAKEIVAKYKAQCEKFPARLPKWEAKKEALEKWVDSLK